MIWPVELIADCFNCSPSTVKISIGKVNHLLLKSMIAASITFVLSFAPAVTFVSSMAPALVPTSDLLYAQV